MKHCIYKHLVYLLIEIHIDYNLWESDYWQQTMLLWMPYKSHGSDQSTNEILQCTLCLLRLSLLSSRRRTWWALCIEQLATVYISWTAIHLLQSQSALSCLWTPCGNPRLLLLSTFFSWQAPGYSSFPLEPNSKCYFIEWLSWWREGCVASVAQPPLGLVTLVEN